MVGTKGGLIAQLSGQIEGGVCIREFESLRTDSEERYFVLRGVAHARAGHVSEIVLDIATRINSPFFSVDIVESTLGVKRLIELGDGQVSDRKQWSASQFAEMIKG